MRKHISIYIHIPFCEKKCNYCAFTSICGKTQTKLDFVDAIKQEIEIRAKEYSGLVAVKSIYIGGGTPSCLPDGMVAEILDKLYKNFVVTNDAEITVEANPSSFTELKAKEYVGAGVTRLSMGLQAKQPHHLKTLGRLHTAEDFSRAVKIARSAGINNISGDIILGVPNQTPAEVKESVEYLKDLNHVSIYMLELEADTPLKRLVDEKIISVPTETETVKLYKTAKVTLESLGFNRYEISNFAKPGFESKHNQVYWERGEYLGFGVSAHSFMNGSRFANASDVAEYINQLKTNTIPLEFKETLTPEESAEEAVMLGLRTTKGINLNILAETFGTDFVRGRKEKIKGLVSDGFLRLNERGNLTATDKGFMVLNRIISIILD